MTPPTRTRLVSQSPGNMPPFFAYSAELRSRSVSEASQTGSISQPYVRRGSATIDALARGLRKKSEVEVVLSGKHEFVRTYSTFDQIQGHVELKFERDTIISDMTVSLEGQSNTYVEKIAAASPTTGRTTGKHTFLRVQQPISAESLPENMLARAHQVYTVPFTFVVPDRLLTYICAHKVDNDETRKEHLQVPPSLGDPMLAGKGNVLMDDLSPDMAKVGYCVKARVSKASPSSGRCYDMEEKACRIRICPAREEAPPLPVEEKSNSWRLRKEKNVRKGVFNIGKKLGRLTAEVAQPKSLRLPSANSTTNTPVTTMAAVTLRFDPASQQEQPPQLGNLAARLKVYTFFGAAAYKQIPETSACDAWSVLHGLYPETVPLSCRNVGGVSWTKHDPENRSKSFASETSTNADDACISRRESTLSTDSSSSTTTVPAPSSAYDSSLPFYSARVLVPISLPRQGDSNDEGSPSSPKTPISRGNKKIIFVPTFHSCIISRSYGLELGLSFTPVNSSGNTTNALNSSSVTLLSPIQISQEGSTAPPADYAEGRLDLSLVEGTDEYDEAMARHLDHELNFTNPFRNRYSTADAIPEYEEVQTLHTNPARLPRHASMAVVPSAAAHLSDEQPPEYYNSPFQANPATVIPPPIGGRRVSVRS